MATHEVAQKTVFQDRLQLSLGTLTQLEKSLEEDSFHNWEANAKPEKYLLAVLMDTLLLLF